MATSEQLKALISAHFEQDPERFTTLALQVAAHEARQGHASVATEIRGLVDKSQANRTGVIPFRPDLGELILHEEPPARLNDLVVDSKIKRRLERVVREFREQSKLREHGLWNRRKLLLAGPPGTGKTMTARVLAGQLSLPLCTILMDKLVTKFMGETGAKLRQVFDVIEEQRAVFLFDEFDAIGGERGLTNDVGEMRRVLNAFLQFIERDKSGGLIIAATNNLRLLDQALFRRFDDVLHFELPDLDQRKRLIANRLGVFKGRTLKIGPIAAAAERLSHAEITQACDDAIKETIMSNQKTVSASLLSTMLEERMGAYGRPRQGA